MKPKILLTSFQTWLPHQKSNSSDDILAEIQKLNYSSLASLFFLRNLPVNIELASHQLIDEIKRIQPEVIICCGMAEKRKKLTIESNASCQNECLNTSIDLEEVTKVLTATKISHNAGKFVCEGLYYQILKHIQLQKKDMHCIFVHVPLLTKSQSAIQKDFHSLILYFAHRIGKKGDIDR